MNAVHLALAIEEIEVLRHRNQILEAQVGVIEVFAAALGLRKNEGASRDILWDLKRDLEELKK